MVPPSRSPGRPMGASRPRRASSLQPHRRGDHPAPCYAPARSETAGNALVFCAMIPHSKLSTRRVRFLSGPTRGAGTRRPRPCIRMTSLHGKAVKIRRRGNGRGKDHGPADTAGSANCGPSHVPPPMTTASRDPSDADPAEAAVPGTAPVPNGSASPALQPPCPIQDPVTVTPLPNDRPTPY